jgi:hypothetical protein
MVSFSSYNGDSGVTSSPVRDVSSSPVRNVYSSPPEWSILSMSPVRSECSCQNQLAHHDWNGVPHPDLPPRCWQFVWGTTKPAMDTAEGDGETSMRQSGCGSD